MNPLSDHILFLLRETVVEQKLREERGERPPRRQVGTLTVEEARDAYSKGLARHAAARARGGIHRHGFEHDEPEERRALDAESAVAEALVAKMLGRRWISDGLVPDGPDDGDVEGGISVRWTPRESGSLIVHEDEPDHLISVLVVGRAPRQRVKGWLTVGEVKAIGTWRTDVRHPAFFAHESLLHPLSLIPPLD